jgi:Tfp pilus assembly protein FimT
MAGLAAISIPAIKHYTPTYNTKQAISSIVSQMQIGRIQAIRNRATTVIVFYPASFTPGGGVGSFLIYEDSNNDWIKDPGENVIVERTYMPPQVSLISASFIDNGSGDAATETTSCGFDSQGLAARNGTSYVVGEVELKNSRNEIRKISFTATGKAKTTIGS